jgi:hypothetical protein
MVLDPRVLTEVYDLSWSGMKLKSWNGLCVCVFAGNAATATARRRTKRLSAEQKGSCGKKESTHNIAESQYRHTPSRTQTKQRVWKVAAQAIWFGVFFSASVKRLFVSSASLQVGLL